MYYYVKKYYFHYNFSFEKVNFHNQYAKKYQVIRVSLYYVLQEKKYDLKNVVLEKCFNPPIVKQKAPLLRHTIGELK
jgi:hypothetical protein